MVFIKKLEIVFLRACVLFGNCIAIGYAMICAKRVRFCLGNKLDLRLLYVSSANSEIHTTRSSIL